MAKTSGKKPSVQSKRARTAAPAKTSGKKPVIAPLKPSKGVVKLAKKSDSSSKPVERPLVKTAAKPSAAAKVPSKKPSPVTPAPAVKPAKVVAGAKPSASAKDNGRSDSKSQVSVPTPAEPVKPRKPNAGLSNRDLENFRELLLAKRRELIGDMSSMEREALRTGGGSNLSNLPIHMADMGTDNYEQEFTLGLVQKDRDLLKEINLALSKMQNGSYGYCEGTGQPIIKERLEFQPWARYSIEHQKKLERHGR